MIAEFLSKLYAMRKKGKMDKNNFEILKLVSDIAEKESDRFWKRFYVMFATNGGLLGYLSFLLKNEYMYLIIPCTVLGIVVSIIWMITIAWSFEYQDRWIKDQIKLISEDDFLGKKIQGRDNEFGPESGNFFERHFYHPRKYLWQFLPVAFSLFWLFHTVIYREDFVSHFF